MSAINKQHQADLISEVIKNYHKHMLRDVKTDEEIFLNKDSATGLTSRQIRIQVESRKLFFFQIASKSQNIPLILNFEMLS